MGLTRSAGLLGLGTGLGSDCVLCHAGRVAGQTIVGLGNSALDMQSLYEDMAAADGLDPVMPLTLCNVRGTSEASNFAIYLMQFRDKELRTRLPVPYTLCPNLCEDIPAWWHLRRKRTIYHLGVADTPLGPDAHAVPADPGQLRRRRSRPGNRTSRTFAPTC